MRSDGAEPAPTHPAGLFGLGLGAPRYAGEAGEARVIELAFGNREHRSISMITATDRDETEAVAQAFAKSQAVRQEARERRAKLAATREALRQKLAALRVEVEKARKTRALMAGTPPSERDAG
jgi:hypothetical protein